MEQDYIDAQALLRALRDAGLDATWEQTGGGVGTMFIGPWACIKGDEDYPFSAALIGPGNYYQDALTTYELAIGQDASYDPTYDDGGTFSWHEGEQVTIATLVATVEAVVAAAKTRWASNPTVVEAVAP